MTDIKAFLCDEAKRITTGPRRSAYGTPEKNFQRIAAFWNVYLQQLGLFGVLDKLSTTDVAAMMRLVKEARLIETPDHLDSYQDLIGYAVTGAEVANVEVPPVAPKEEPKYYDTAYMPTNVPPLAAMLGAKPRTLDNDRIVPRRRLPDTEDGPLI